jgi:hypothetical protein
MFLAGDSQSKRAPKKALEYSSMFSKAVCAINFAAANHASAARYRLALKIIPRSETAGFPGSLLLLSLVVSFFLRRV